MASLIGEHFAGYQIERLLRHGGMASVYLARHDILHRRAALKILAPALAQDERFRIRFLQESKTAASLEHPSIVPVYDAGDAEGSLYIAMRFIDGTDLKSLLEEKGPLEPARAVSLLTQVASALDAAHAAGLVHRDVKPSNILIAPPTGPGTSERAYLTDFGITKQITAGGALTGTSEVLGTLEYMAPEQIEGLAIDARTDVYALGCVLYESLAGVPPFAGGTVAEVLHGHLAKPPPRISAVHPALGTEIDNVIATAMAKSPADRYTTGSALVLAAEAALDPRRALPAVVVTPEGIPSSGATPTVSAPADASPPSAPPWISPRPGAVAVAGPASTTRRTRRLRLRPAALLALAVLLVGLTATGVALRQRSAAPPQRSSSIPPPTLGLGLVPVPVTGTDTPAPATLRPASPRPAPSRSGAAAIVLSRPSPSRSPAAPSAAAATTPAQASPTSPTTAAVPSPSPDAAWPATAPANSQTGCEPKWSWTCEPPGHCPTVAFYGDSGPIPADTSRAYQVTVGQDGTVCAFWSNPGITGTLLDPNGQELTGGKRGNQGILAHGLAPGTYTVSLRHTDASKPDHTSLQING